MGSGASSSVKDFNRNDNTEIECLDRSNNELDSSAVRPRSGTSHLRKQDAKVTPISNSELGEVKTDVVRCQSLLYSAQKQVKDAAQNAQDMESQMAELESQNLDLLDQVAALEHQLEVIQQSPDGATDWTQTLSAKEQYIEYLEGQAETTQKQITILKKKFRKKLRILNTQLSEAKQGQSVQSFEQQQQLQKLSAENEKLKEQVRRGPSDATSTGVEDLSDNRTRIILELSGKVSEQDSIITDLEAKLSEKDAEIERLRDDKGENNAKTLRSQKRWETSSPSSARTQLVHDTSCKDTASPLDEYLTMSSNSGNDIDELKALAEEMKRAHRGKRHKNREGSDYRESSGVSRDSGIVTLANGKDKNSNKIVDSDWADSDSDTELTDRLRPNSGSLPTSAHSRISTTSDVSNTENDLGEVTVLDPFSIRQISAAKLRKGKKVHAGIRSPHGKPPPYRDSIRQDSAVDSLITDLDAIGTKSLVPVS